MPPLRPKTIEQLTSALDANAGRSIDDPALREAIAQVRAELDVDPMRAPDIMALLHQLIAQVPAVRLARDTETRDGVVQRLMEACLAACFNPRDPDP